MTFTRHSNPATRLYLGTAELAGGAAVVEFRPDTEGRLIFLTVQEARGTVGTPYVSHRVDGGFVISSTSPDDRSLVGWFIIE